MADKANIWEEVKKKFPKAKMTAVENFTAYYERLSPEASLNLSLDARLYKWNVHTVSAIKFVLNNKKHVGKK